MTLVPANLHDFFDGIEGLAILGGMVFFIYDRLKLTSAHSEQIIELNDSIHELTLTVNTLAVTVGNLQGRFEQMGRGKY